MVDLTVRHKMNVVVAFIAESNSLWHARLGHVNIVSIKRLKQFSLIPTFNNYKFDKCEICVKAKIRRSPLRKM